MTGSVIIDGYDHIPPPTVPDRWTFDGYSVKFDAPSRLADFAPTLAEAVKTIEYGLSNCLQISAECKRVGRDEDGEHWEERMACYWKTARNQWTEWRPV